MGLTLASVGVLCAGCGPGAEPSVEYAPPALVVVVTVDQLRADLLEMYAPALQGGFARLSRGGQVFTRASHLHASTSTAVGHATLAAGVAPWKHGLVGNDFWHLDDGGEPRSVYSVADETESILGFPEMAGRSPRNMLRQGLADWMVAADSGTRVVSVSRKDRAEIPMAGQVAGHVYWIAEGRGQFATSSYYRSENPGWVDEFNETRMREILGGPVWESVTPDTLTGLARRDSAAYEGDGVHVVFPHRRDAEADGELPGAYIDWAEDTPAPDRAVLEFAKTAMRELELGRRSGGPDFLALSFSQTDNVGHSYGPVSQEQLSNLIHLDGLVAELVGFLNEEVGAGRWVLGLSGDHGVMTIPEWLAESGEEARRLTREERRELNRVAAEAARSAVSGADGQSAIARAVEVLPWIQRAYTPSDLMAASPDSMTALFARSHLDGRGWGPLGRYGVYVQFREGILNRTSSRGTGHGSPYWHDRHVPLIVYGGGVAPAVRSDVAYTFDLAPTLAELAEIPVPSDLDGRSLAVGPGGNP